MASGKALCPICKTEVELDLKANKHSPFCSARCKSVDLGRWLDERYTTPTNENEDEG